VLGCRSLRPDVGRKQIRHVHIEGGGNPVQRFQGGIGFGDLQRTDECLANVRLIGEIVLRP